MYEVASDGLTFLSVQTFTGFLALFWYVLLFEVPRYVLPFFVAAFVPARRRGGGRRDPAVGRVSVLIVGHNEETTIETCVLSLHEQSHPPEEIVVVSDGSTDRMPEKIRELLARGLIQRGHCMQLRGGKSAGVNLAERLASGDILVNIDCDCVLDRHALREIVRPFADECVAAVAGNIAVRNPRQSLVATFQAVEYLISLSLGKYVLDMIDQVSCASGAFSAFRRVALDDVGGLDSGGGEDLDVTLRLRRAGWRIEYAPDSVCFSNAPASFSALVRQRFRWERDAVQLRYRKHSGVLNPFSHAFRPGELFHELEFLAFNVVGAFAFPLYILWLVLTYGDFALVILVAAQAGMLVLDVVLFAAAAYANPHVPAAGLIAYVPGFSLFNGYVMRAIRIAAYTQEWVYRSSYRDPYVPAKVHRARR